VLRAAARSWVDPRRADVNIVQLGWKSAAFHGVRDEAQGHRLARRTALSRICPSLPDQSSPQWAVRRLPSSYRALTCSCKGAAGSR
jgi:hypothetical protein